jgi:hypothetical protein
MGLARLAVLGAFGLAWLALPVGGAHAGTPMRALSDDLAFLDSRAAERALAFQAARRAGARMVHITLDWSLVAPSGSVKPAGFDAANPGDQAYRWGYVEEAVRDAAQQGLQVAFVVVRAPVWAEGRERPISAPAGSWQPQAPELAAFVRAAARRFSGFYPDPKSSGDGLTGRGSSLPRVRFWQIWTRPNASDALLASGNVVELYRQMLNAASRALKRVAPGNVVVAGGTTAAGALRFWRALLCLSPSGRRVPCSEAARFDVAAHSPTPPRRLVTGGSERTLGLDRLNELTRYLALATRTNSARPSREKPLWVTDIGWDTPPRSPYGVSATQQARNLSRAMYLADRARASLVGWTGLQDRLTYLPNFPSVASGLFFNRTNSLARDPAKPSLRAYRFPFLIHGSRAWGIAPRRRAVVTVERRGERGWGYVRSVKPWGSGEFAVRVEKPRGLYRARQGRKRSLPWSAR